MLTLRQKSQINQSDGFSCLDLQSAYRVTAWCILTKLTQLTKDDLDYLCEDSVVVVDKRRVAVSWACGACMLLIAIRIKKMEFVTWKKVGLYNSFYQWKII